MNRPVDQGQGGMGGRCRLCDLVRTGTATTGALLLPSPSSRRNAMPDKYPSMRDLYAHPMNVEGTTYANCWKRHELIQLVEAQAIDNPETEKVVLAIHGGGIEGGKSEIALAVAGIPSATFSQ